MFFVFVFPFFSFFNLRNTVWSDWSSRFMYIFVSFKRWSFGIVLFEIYTLGATPYAGMNNQEVITRLREGYRLPKPDGMPGCYVSLEWLIAIWSTPFCFPIEDFKLLAFQPQFEYHVWHQTKSFVPLHPAGGFFCLFSCTFLDCNSYFPLILTIDPFRIRRAASVPLGKGTKFALHHGKMSTTKHGAKQILHISTFQFTFKYGYNYFISKYTDINSLHVTQIDLLHNDTFCST